MPTHGGPESGRPASEEAPFMEAHGNPRLRYGVGVWVRRQVADRAQHRCFLPETGTQGDLWRCGCGALWRLGDACDWCDRLGIQAHQGQCVVGVRWRPATLWQRFRHWRPA